MQILLNKFVIGVFEMYDFSLTLIQQLIFHSDVLPKFNDLLLVMVLLLLQLLPKTLILYPKIALLFINGSADDCLPGGL